MATSSWSWTGEDEPFKWAWAVQFATGPSRHTTECPSAHLHGQLSSVTLGLVWLCLFMSPKTWLHWARPPSPCGQGGSSGWLGSRPQLLWEVILTCISAHPLCYIANSKDMLTLIFTWCVCVCVNHVKGHVSTQIYEHLHLGKSYTDTDTRCCQPGE